MTVKHLKKFVSAVAILAALILGLMCLAPLPADQNGGPCVEVAPGVWRQEDPATDELTKPCSNCNTSLTWSCISSTPRVFELRSAQGHTTGSCV